jgi:hypothetical protein
MVPQQKSPLVDAAHGVRAQPSQRFEPSLLVGPWDE